MKKKPHAGDSERQRRSIASIALITGSLIGAVILGGQYVASLASGVTVVGTAVAAPTRAETETAAATPLLLGRLDHTVVNQHSTAHDSDLPGASIAAYGM
ncbi:hypothetical protein [Polaromonas sp. JS666]|uniref:hypothetical protein n=1 Tax=Polaromonas sp. (strain JS666 / ATCC BAA-500) TaxID=296591 RepID=UPI0000464E6F|nr:hypothetical protein [Polaromonas sp. JS666]ABE42672.1 hypothetical protein Bpro_0715 [Polaromonas sp. JS666]